MTAKVPWVSIASALMTQEASLAAHLKRALNELVSSSGIGPLPISVQWEGEPWDRLEIFVYSQETKLEVCQRECSHVKLVIYFDPLETLQPGVVTFDYQLSFLERMVGFGSGAVRFESGRSSVDGDNPFTVLLLLLNGRISLLVSESRPDRWSGVYDDLGNMIYGRLYGGWIAGLQLSLMRDLRLYILSMGTVDRAQIVLHSFRLNPRSFRLRKLDAYLKLPGIAE